MRAAIVRSGGPGEAHHCETHDPITGVAQEEARRVKETDTMAKRDRHDVENTCRQSDVLRSRARVGASGAMRLSPPNRADSPQREARRTRRRSHSRNTLTKHTHETHTRNTHTTHANALSSNHAPESGRLAFVFPPKSLATTHTARRRSRGRRKRARACGDDARAPRAIDDPTRT